jgi:hypothetical protein
VQEVPGGDYTAFADNFGEYLEGIQADLEAQTPDSYIPNLSVLDEMIRSLRID